MTRYIINLTRLRCVFLLPCASPVAPPVALVCSDPSLQMLPLGEYSLHCVTTINAISMQPKEEPTSIVLMKVRLGWLFLLSMEGTRG